MGGGGILSALSALQGQGQAPPQQGPDISDIENAASQAPQNLASALQQAQQNANQPPQQSPQGQQPDPIDTIKQNLAQQYQANQPPPPSGGPVRRFLQNFFSGMGQTMMHDAGLPTPYEQQQKALSNIMGLTNMQDTHNLHQAMAGQYGQVEMDDGTKVQVKDIPAYMRATATRDAAQGFPLSDEMAQAIGHPELKGQPLNKAFAGILGQQAGKVLVTPDMVQQYGMPPEAVNKYVKMSDILSAEKTKAALGGRTTTSGTWKETSPNVFEYLPVSRTTKFNNAPGGATPPRPTSAPGAPPVQGGTETAPAAPASSGNRKVYGGGSIYAYDPKTNETVMTTPQEASANGYSNPRKVTQANITSDTQLNNRLYDVARKVDQYDQFLKTAKLTDAEKGNIAGLLSSDKLKVGAFGAEIPVDRVNQVMDAENIKGLSPQAQRVLAAYYNARESMQGYSRVLSGSGRSSDTGLGLNLQALPSPVMPDTFIGEGVRQFKENIGIAAQGLPRMPGIHRATEIVGGTAGGSNGQRRVIDLTK